MGPSKVYLQEIKVYLNKIRAIMYYCFFFFNKIQVYIIFYQIFYKIIGF